VNIMIFSPPLLQWNPRKALLFLLIFLLPSDPCKAFIVDGIAAKVNDQIITISDVRQKVNEIAKAKRITSKSTLEKIKATVLKQMIEDKLFLLKADDLKITGQAKDVDSAIAEIRDQNNLTEDQFSRMLKMNGLTLDRYREGMKNKIIISKVIGMLIRSKVKVTEKEIQDYFDKHKKNFTTPEEVKASHILITFKKGIPERRIRDKAYEIYRKLSKGENFASLARLYSEDATSSDGGNLGFFKRGVMVPEFEKAAFRLKVGETGRPIRTKFGYHIIRVTGRKAPTPVSMKKARPSIEKKLRQEKYQAKYREALKELREKTSVEIIRGQGPLASPREKEKKRQPLLRTRERRPKIPDIGEGIKALILKWKRAGEKKDFRTYASCYADDFRSNRKDKRQWLAQQKKFASAYQRIRYTIRDLRVSKKGLLYMATFSQEFTSDKGRLLFTRRLYLTLRGEAIKIIGEKWVKQEPNFKGVSKGPRLNSGTKVHILDVSS